MNDPVVVRKLNARIDLAVIFATIGERSLEAADRFLLETEKTLVLLARSPGIGESCETDDPELKGLRCFRMKKFKNHVIFYVPIDNGIEVVRILHAARDIRTAFDSDY